MYASVRAPGACGELVQGVLNDTNFLITCPINKYSEISVKLLTQTNEIYSPVGKNKACKAVRSVLSHFGRDYGAEITVKSELPIGKGMASSTADLSAAALATALALGEQLPLEFIAELALSIEPSDGTFYPGIVMFDHLHGTISRELGNPPPMRIMIIDLGGEVDTVEFNRQEDLLAKNLAKEKQIAKAVELITTGIAQNDPLLIGEAASISSIANQPILFKPHLEDLLDVVMAHGGYGINVAHSGTVVGVLLDQEDNRILEWQYLMRSVIKTDISFLWAGLIGGGLVPQVVQRNNEVWCNQ